ncbi:MAG: GH3 auxin-responsive promoter family protein [Tolypothrix carrinoi HA7290-LM1]|nr:GH3 auxin-responsive promoter family protein [Tolypothrix carrinoi HA7290-LM1]
MTHWIQTSGTTGTPKLFPYNQEFENNLWAASSAPTNCFIYRVGSQALKILEGESLFIHASGDCGTIGTGATRKSLGFMTGWLAKNSPPDNPFAPPRNIQLIPDWEERILQIAVYYVQKNVTRLSGVSTYGLMFLQQLENAFDGKLFPALAEVNPKRAAELEQFYYQDGKLKISQIWTNLLCLSLGGVNPFQYQNWIEKNLPKSIIFQFYVGSEGFYGFQYDIHDPAMVLLPKNAFYEFLDIDEYTNWQFHNRNTPTRYTVADVKAGKEYVFCISNYLGFTTYIPGDIIKVVSTQPFLFVYSRRLGKEVNISAEKMSEEHITVAMKEAAKKNDCVYCEYLCAAITEPFPHYVVAVDFSTLPDNLEKFATDTEQSICQSNFLYEEVRRTNVLQPLRVINVPAGEFERYMVTKTKAGEWNPGQMKLPRLTDRQDFISFFQVSSEGISRFL